MVSVFLVGLGLAVGEPKTDLEKKKHFRSYKSERGPVKNRTVDPRVFVFPRVCVGLAKEAPLADSTARSLHLSRPLVTCGHSINQVA